ncbi:unnamed protein product [Mortierella alpina]
MNTTTTTPNTEDPPSSPTSSIFPSVKRYLSSISPRKTLRNLRLLILALAFGTLILDAITLSFEINVMNLDLAQKQVATQAALLFTPDLLAMTMALVLMLRDCFGCCRTRRPRQHHEEYDGSEAYQEQDQETEGHQQQLRQQPEHKDDALPEKGQEQEGADPQRGENRSRTKTSRRRTARELHQDVSRSSSSSSSNNSIENRDIDHGQMALAQEQRSSKFPGVHVLQQQQQQLQHFHHPQEQLRYETNRALNHHSETQQPNHTSPPTGLELTAAVTTSGPLDHTKRASIPLSSSTTLSTPSPIPTTTTSSAITATVTMTTDSHSMHTKASSTGASQSRTKQRRRKRHSYYYIAFRILFSCGLAVLALYWPASKRKPPLGYLPNLKESQNQHQGDGSDSHDNSSSDSSSSRGADTQHNSTITSTIVTRALLSYESSRHMDPIPPIPATGSTSITLRSNKRKRQSPSSHDDDGSSIEDSAKSDNLENSAAGHYGHSSSEATSPGGRIPPNLRPGGPGSGGYGSHWCSLEEAFGDNQSAVVYCQVKDVRPVMTYVWASLILLELCVAYCAGDFAVAGTRRQKGRSQLVAVDDEDHDLESKEFATTAEDIRSGTEAQSQRPPWTTGGQSPVHAQGLDPHMGHSGISITVTEAGAEGAGVGHGGTMNRGQTLHGRIGSQIDR